MFSCPRCYFQSTFHEQHPPENIIIGEEKPVAIENHAHSNNVVMKDYLKVSDALNGDTKSRTQLNNSPHNDTIEDPKALSSQVNEDIKSRHTPLNNSPPNNAIEDHKALSSRAAIDSNSIAKMDLPGKLDSLLDGQQIPLTNSAIKIIDDVDDELHLVSSLTDKNYTTVNRDNVSKTSSSEENDNLKSVLEPSTSKSDTSSSNINEDELNFSNRMMNDTETITIDIEAHNISMNSDVINDGTSQPSARSRNVVEVDINGSTIQKILVPNFSIEPNFVKSNASGAIKTRGTTGSSTANKPPREPISRRSVSVAPQTNKKRKPEKKKLRRRNSYHNEMENFIDINWNHIQHYAPDMRKSTVVSYPSLKLQVRMSYIFALRYCTRQTYC